MQAGVSIMIKRHNVWALSAQRSGPEFICLNTNFDTSLNLNYSVPFMQAGISIMMKRHNVRANSLFSFLAPLSSEIWTSLMSAYLGVSTNLFLMSRIYMPKYKF